MIDEEVWVAISQEDDGNGGVYRYVSGVFREKPKPEDEAWGTEYERFTINP